MLQWWRSRALGVRMVACGLWLVATGVLAGMTDAGQAFDIEKRGPPALTNEEAHEVDSIDTYGGSLKVRHEDLRVKGPAGLDMVVWRNYTPTMSWSGNYRQMGTPVDRFGGWELRVAPVVMLSGANNNGRVELGDKLCNGRDWNRRGMVARYGPNGEDPYWSDDTGWLFLKDGDADAYTLHHVDGGQEALLPVARGEVRSKSGWKLTCSGSSYTLRSPDGWRYEMTSHGLQGGNPFYQQLMVDRIVDANGNWIRIDYVSGYWPSRMSNAEGSFIDFSYIDRGAQGVVALVPNAVRDQAGRTWKYETALAPGNPFTEWSEFQQNNLSDLGSTGQDLQLRRVVRPDGSSWTYTYWDRFSPNPQFTSACVGWGAYNPSHPDCARAASSGLMRSVQYPGGGTLTYTYAYQSGVMSPMWPFEWFYAPMIYNDVEGASMQDRFNYSARVTKRASSDGGVWTYSYAPSTTQGVPDTTTIVTPSGTQVFKHIGVGYVGDAGKSAYAGTAWPYTNRGAWKVGLLLEKSVDGLYKEVNTWDSVVHSTFWSEKAGGAVLLADPNQTLKPVLKTRTITQDGGVYTTSFSNFDAYGNPGTVAETGPGGGSRTTTRTYLNDTNLWIIGRPKSETSPATSITRSFDAKGNLTSVTQDGVTTSYTYDAQGQLASQTLPRGLVHTYKDYKFGVPTTEQQPEGLTISRTLDTAGNISSETRDGKRYAYGYDGLSRMTLKTPPTGTPTSTVYTATSKTVTRGPLVETTVYNGFGRATSVTLGGVTTNYQLDALGRVVFKANPNDTIGTGYAYDTLSRLVTITWPTGATYRQAYGPDSEASMSERGFITRRPFRSYGDPQERHLMAVNAPDATASMTLTRDAADRVTSVTQGGLTRSYAYNVNGYLVSMTEPEIGTTTYSRDAAGNMTSRNVAGSGASTYVYDGQNRLASVNYANWGANGGPSVTHKYTPTGKPLEVKNATATRSYVYDANENLIAETLAVDGQSFTSQYGYNARDQLATVTYPSGRVVDYSPDALGRPTQVSGFASLVSYFPSGMVHEIRRTNGAKDFYTQNTRLWPWTYLGSTGNGGSITLQYYNYDESGNLKLITSEVDYQKAMTYDAVDRLVSVTSPKWGTGTISYTGTGNIASQVYGSNALYYTYDAAGRLSEVSGGRAAKYVYDRLGNMSASTDNVQYDSVPNLQCVACGTANETRYGYDGLNQRVWVQKAGAKVYEVYGSHGMQLAEYSPTDATRRTDQIYLGNKRIAQVTNGETTALHNDAAGSPIGATNADGSLKWKETYYPYGAQINKQAASKTNRLWFTGKPYDENTQLSYMGARYYDPVLGRFMGMDPAPVDPQNLQSFNRYAYANNSPYKFVDPDGRQSLALNTAIAGGEGGLALCGPVCAAAGAVGGGLVGLWISKKLVDHVVASTDQSANGDTVVPPVPDKIVGSQTDSRAGTRKSGKSHTSGPLTPENGGKGDYAKDLQTLTGGTKPAQPGDAAPPGSDLGANGVFGRPDNSSGGASIDIPANGNKPHETLHYPKQ